MAECTCDPEAYETGPEGQRRYFEDRYCPLHGEQAREDSLWIEVSSEHRHASPRVWCVICQRIEKARENLDRPPERRGLIPTRPLKRRTTLK